MKKKLLLVLMLMSVLFLLSACKKKTDDNYGGVSTAEMQELYNDEMQRAIEGKYKNLVVHPMKCNIDNIEKIYSVKVHKNTEYKNNTHKDNLEKMISTINNFFGKDFDTSIISVRAIYNNENDNDSEISIEEMKNQLDSGTFKADKYFILFGDAREKGGKGFAQIDSGFCNIWFSRGIIPATMPMYEYSTKKVYNFAVSTDEINEEIKLQDGKITIKAAAEYVEKYLNEELPFEKNEKYRFSVAEARVLEVDDQYALGFCVRKTYNGIPFDYTDGATSGIYVSDFEDERGEVCMINRNEIDNICGLGEVQSWIENNGKEIERIISLDDALESVSKSIGDNSIYDVYGIEIVYQFVIDSTDETGETTLGTPVWKIITQNKNDNKYTCFYVDLKTGKVNHTYKNIYGTR